MMNSADQTDADGDARARARPAVSDLLDPEHERLLACSMPAMETLHQQLASPSLSVLLADRQGLILGVVGRQHATLPGSPIATGETAESRDSSAQDAEPGAFAVFVGERIVMGVTAPILAPQGGVLGILDFSASPFDNLSHAGALLHTTAGIIEHRLIESDQRGFLVLRFHTHPGVLGSPLEALAVFDRDSSLVVGNRVARNLLEMDERKSRVRCPDCFDAPWAGLVGQAALSVSEPFMLRTCRGGQLFARASLRQPLVN